MLALPLYDDNPRTRPAVATYGIVAACVVVFLWQTGLPPHAAYLAPYRLGFIPAVFFGAVELPARIHAWPPAATIITSMFLHGDLLHIGGNMLYLWIFGKAVEAALGPLRFLLFYFICGIVAALTQGFVEPNAEVPMIGASGAIAGVLGAYFVLFPRSNVATFVWVFIFIRIVALPAVVLLGLWFGLQLLSALAAKPGEPGVAFWAHVGGFVAGMVLVMFFRRRGVPALQPSRSRAYAVTRPGAMRRRGPWG
jgi:membrane associated rhomboid family serine protease